MAMNPLNGGNAGNESLFDLLGVPSVAEGAQVTIADIHLQMREGILRAVDQLSQSQQQTSDVFGYKWARRDTYDSPQTTAATKAWLVERYGNAEEFGWLFDAPGSVLLDAGCGSGVTALALFGERLNRIRYLGADVSASIDVAAARFRERGVSGAFLQCDLMRLPLPNESVHAILSEGVIHHTDSAERAFHQLARLLKLGGRFMFYVYRKKGPIREFVDDHLRDALHAVPPQEAWDALMPLSKLGKHLGELGVTVNVPESIDLLEIPAGPIDLQRLFYWHIFKAYYRPELTLDEMNHINFDWYAPRNASRHTIEQVRAWCSQAGLSIERERVEEAGITIIARK